MIAGDVVVCDFGDPIGHEAAFRRPAVVVSPEQLNRHGIAVVVPVTRTARGYPTHVELDGILPVISYAQCELIRSVSTERCGRHLAELDEATLSRVRRTLSRLIGTE